MKLLKNNLQVQIWKQVDNQLRNKINHTHHNKIPYSIQIGMRLRNIVVEQTWYQVWLQIQEKIR